MELFEIQSTNDLSEHLPQMRSPVAHSYLISRRQFMFVLGNWRKPDTARGPAGGRDVTFSMITLAAQQIWMTESEITQIASAIQSFHSRVSLA